MIQELEDAYNRAKQRAALAEKAVELHDKLSRVKDELTWCYVFDAEKVVFLQRLHLNDITHLPPNRT